MDYTVVQMSVVAFSDVERVTETNVCRDRPRETEGSKDGESRL
jgi:hypothetical protein